ncbi:hypothetical protein HRbin14_01848 [bacterium HR14]|nr:hypothetical protein HRbin14_01848 [bacterium HR14]
MRLLHPLERLLHLACTMGGCRKSDQRTPAPVGMANLFEQGFLFACHRGMGEQLAGGLRAEEGVAKRVQGAHGGLGLTDFRPRLSHLTKNILALFSELAFCGDAFRFANGLQAQRLISGHITGDVEQRLSASGQIFYRASQPNQGHKGTGSRRRRL